jgi:hypothetical protein
MNWFKSISLVGVLLVAAPALAQQRPVPPAQRPLRGYLIGGGGASINTAQTSVMLSAEIAENVTRVIQAYMSVNFYDCSRSAVR